MGIKRMIAAALAATMILGSALSVSAATSPVNPGYDTKKNIDENKQDHYKKTVDAKISGNSATVVSVESSGKKTSGQKTVVFKVARNAKNKQVPVTNLGNKKKGIFDSKKGRNIETVKITSAKRVTINKLTFKGSKVKNLYASSKLRIRKNAFKGTKVKNLYFRINGKKKAAKNYTFEKGAFNGLSKKARIVVSKKTMTKKQFNLLKKKLQKAGFKGKIKRA